MYQYKYEYTKQLFLGSTNRVVVKIIQYRLVSLVNKYIFLLKYYY